MRILHAVRSDAFAGVERHVATLAAAQAQAGHEVAVVGGDQHRMTAELAPRGVRTVEGGRTVDVLTAVRRQASAFDVVHAHMTAAELACSLASGPPLVATRHFARARGATPVGRLAGALVRRRVRAQIAISQYVADAVEGEATVIYPGVPAADPSSEGREPVMVIVQRLEREKDTPTALRAFAAGAPQDWCLEVVGDGAERPALEALAASLGVADRVRFRGFQTDVGAILRRASVLLAPCPVEGLGLAVLEAMSCSLPVVASDAGAHPETVGRAAGARLFAPGDWREAADQIDELCGSDDLLRSYGAELRRVQQEWFSLTRQVEETDRLYRTVCG